MDAVGGRRDAAAAVRVHRHGAAHGRRDQRRQRRRQALTCNAKKPPSLKLPLFWFFWFGKIKKNGEKKNKQTNKKSKGTFGVGGKGRGRRSGGRGGGDAVLAPVDEGQRVDAVGRHLQLLLLARSVQVLHHGLTNQKARVSVSLSVSFWCWLFWPRIFFNVFFSFFFFCRGLERVGNVDFGSGRAHLQPIALLLQLKFQLGHDLHLNPGLRRGTVVQDVLAVQMPAIATTTTK